MHGSHRFTLAQSSSPTPQQEPCPFRKEKVLASHGPDSKAVTLTALPRRLSKSLPVIVNLSHRLLLVPANHLRPLQQPGRSFTLGTCCMCIVNQSSPGRLPAFASQLHDPASPEWHGTKSGCNCSKTPKIPTTSIVPSKMTCIWTSPPHCLDATASCAVSHACQTCNNTIHECRASG